MNIFNKNKKNQIKEIFNNKIGKFKLGSLSKNLNLFKCCPNKLKHSKLRKNHKKFRESLAVLSNFQIKITFLKNFKRQLKKPLSPNNR